MQKAKGNDRGPKLDPGETGENSLLKEGRGGDHALEKWIFE